MGKCGTRSQSDAGATGCPIGFSHADFASVSVTFSFVLCSRLLNGPIAKIYRNNDARL
jgi:hypothetical protein